MKTKMSFGNWKPEQESKIILFSSAQKTKKIEVKQLCGFCGKHIEKVAQSVNGVNLARWGNKSQMLIVKYDSRKTSLDDIELAIAKAGHDTPNHKRKVKFYTDMPECCKFRNEALSNMA